MYEEYWPGALPALYGGRAGWVYTCAPAQWAETDIPNERVCSGEVPVTGCEYVPDAYAALLEAERQGELLIRRYEQMTPGTRRWLEQAISDGIRQKSLWKTDTPYARYIRLHYPEIWNRALENLP